MIKLKRVVTDKGFILEEIESDKVNKKLIDDGEVKGLDLPHVENNPESVQDHIDAVKEVVDKEKEEMEKKALETKSEDRVIFAESKLFKDRSEMSSFIVKLKEQKIKHRVVPLHEDTEGYKFELRYEKPLNESLTESYETAFEVCEDGSKVSAVGSFKHTRNYTHELVDFDCASGSGSGDYRWMNRPWQRFTFAEALREAMINAGVDEKCARDCIENSYSLKSALKYYAEHCCKKEEEPAKEECLKENEEISLDTLEKAMDDIDVSDIDIIEQPGREERHKDDVKAEPKLETFDEQMDFLASDEQEAIDDYEKVLELVEDENVKEQLEKILEEEKAHKEFLEKVKEDASLTYPLKKEDKKDDEESKEDEDDDLDDVKSAEEIEVDEYDDFDWEPSLEESIEENSDANDDVESWDDLED